MYDKLMQYLKKRPEVYEPGEPEFWSDPHISKGMLEAHLDTEMEAATRKLDFVCRSAKWIAQTADTKNRPLLLDLGCGPGIYAELFCRNGFEVTGVDFSARSIAYARAHADAAGLDIRYRNENYLDLDEEAAYDVITLIYCDFGVLSGENRKRLAQRICRALKPNGLFIVDVCSMKQYDGWEEKRTWSYDENGFWSERPYVCLYSFYRYDSWRTFLEQYVIVENDNERCFNIWNHGFTAEELEADLKTTGFDSVRFYGSVAGDVLTQDSVAICAVAQKAQQAGWNEPHSIQQ